MVGQPDLPPWEPIADWLARLNGASKENVGSNVDKYRNMYEEEAKAVAYDIATYDRDLSESDMEHQIAENINSALGGDE